MSVPVRRVKAKAEATLDLSRRRYDVRLPEGFVQLFYGDGRPIRIANEYMYGRTLSLMRARKPWAKTQAALADDLAQATIFLHLLGLKWDDISRPVVEQYSVALIAGYSVWTQKKRSPSTIHRRMTTLVDACRFGFEKGYISSNIVGSSPRPVSTFLRGSRTPDDISHVELEAVLPRRLAPDAQVNPILHLRAILDALGSESPAPGTPRRDRVAAETTLFTGLRVDETAGLTVYQILHLAEKMERNANWRELRLELDAARTKGGVGGSVLIPCFHINTLVNYIDGERAEIVNYARDIHGSAYTETPALFLNGIGCNHRDIGKPCRPETFSKAFTRAVMACNLTRREERLVLKPDGSIARDAAGTILTERVDCAAHNFHDLRHTFAVTQYIVRKANGERDPLKSVQTLLRHKLSQTTIDIYLRWLSVYEKDFSAELSRHYRNLDEWAEGKR